jgi:hypothetical protein
MAEGHKINFLGVVSFMGAILILLGITWIIASNWRVIPGFLKIFILITATLLALTSGAVLKDKKHMEFTGRSLLLLGGGLFVLSVFLITQILYSHSSQQLTVNLILLCWPVLFLIAYLLDSEENILMGLVAFGIWIISQYLLIAENENIALTIIVLFVMIGTVLYGIRQLHKVFNHRFYKLYTFWTVFYILLGAFLLTFQAILSHGVLRSEGAIGLTNPFFLIIALCFTFFFIISMIISLNKEKKDLKEILIFIGIIFIILLSVFFIRASNIFDDTGDDDGYCNEDWKVARESCSNIRNEESCGLNEDCLWTLGGGAYCETNNTNRKQFCSEVNGVEICNNINCYNFRTDEGNCEKMNEYGCYWNVRGTCVKEGEQGIVLQNCYDIKNKPTCEEQESCEWKKRYSYRNDLNWFSYILWILYNVFFVGLIILMIGYGREEGQRRVIDIAFLFFIVDIISRYIGFMMDLSGYLTFSLAAIMGGIILIVGAYLIQKYWRKEIKDIREVKKNEAIQAN